MGNPSQGNAIWCQFGGSARGQLCCDPWAPLHYSQKLHCPRRGPANWVMLLENKTDTLSTGRLHVKNQGHHSFVLQREIWCLLKILGRWPWGPLSDPCPSIGCLPREKEPLSHQKRYGDAVRQLRVLYSRLQWYPDPYEAIGPGCLEVPQGVTQAAVCCLRAATTGLEAWHMLGRGKRCSKRSTPTL